MLIQPKGEKVMLVAGSKNTAIKAGDWIKNIAPIVAEAEVEDPTLPKQEEKIFQKSMKQKKRH